MCGIAAQVITVSETKVPVYHANVIVDWTKDLTRQATHQQAGVKL